MKVQEKNITKTKTKRLISESLRKNITKTKTKRIISEINQQQQQPPPAAAIHTYPRAAVTIRIISERNLQQQQQQPPPKETGYDYTPSPPPMKKSQTKGNTL